jgi:hypothetical protein
MARLAQLRARMARLADPRNLSQEEEARLPGEIYDIAAWNMALFDAIAPEREAPEPVPGAILRVLLNSAH